MAFCFFANRVLDGSAWARERLAPFAASVIELRAPLPLLPNALATITAQGRLEPGGDAPPAATVAFPPLAVSGEPGLAAALQELARTLRWDGEEELSQVFGDVVAHRMAEGARAAWRWQADAASRLGEALAEYAADEARLVVRRGELAAFAASVEALTRALDELAQRIGRLG